MDKKSNIPVTINFKLSLHGKLANLRDKLFEGVAKLSSPEESFSDSADRDGGDYFAADYIFANPDYEVLIRLDTENYDACVISVTTKNPDKLLGGYKNLVKNFRMKE